MADLGYAVSASIAAQSVISPGAGAIATIYGRIVLNPPHCIAVEALIDPSEVAIRLPEGDPDYILSIAQSLASEL